MSSFNDSLTTASAHSTAYSASSANCSPSCSSISVSPYFSTQYQTPLASVDPFDLPEPAIPSSYPTTIPYSPSYPRQNGLTRKLSSGKRALSRLGRTASSGAASRREPSSGPVARRRSDSKTSTAATFESGEPLPEIPSGFGLGLHNHLGLAEEGTSSSEHAIRKEQRAEIVAPAVPAALIAGCVLTKINKRRFQDKVFALDSQGSTVSWMGTVTLKQFYIDNIKSIRTGLDPASSVAVATGLDLDASRCFTINYAPSQSSKGTKTLHLLAPTKHICSLWVNTLESLSKHREELMLEMSGSERQSVLKAYWDYELARQNQNGDNNKASGLNRNTVVALCQKLHIHCLKSVIDEAFSASDPHGTGLLDFVQFRNFVRRLKSRLDIKPLYNSLKPLVPGGAVIDGISREDFFRFLEREQGVSLETNLSYWNERFDTLAASSDPPIQDSNGIHYMGFSAFTSFILSPDCHVHAPTERAKTRLTRPMNEYFISSSHNTYLLGRQVNGTSSVEPYVSALRRGCRSVEIDCWDGDNNTPRVTHGYTGTTSITFSEVVHAINRCAFDASPYPVILSLEVHCNPSQQLRMVEIMKEGFEPGRLLEYPLAQHQSDLPSPEELKYKILVKVKATNAHPLPTSIGEALSATRQRSTSSPVRKTTTIQPVLPPQPSYGSGSPLLNTPPESVSSPTDLSMVPTSEEEPESDVNSAPPASVDSTSVRKTSKITSDLAKLGVYMQGYSYRSFTDLTFRHFNHIFSINEHTAMSVAKGADTKTLFEKHNMSFMCRVYPKNTRLNSSNFDPNTFWRRGVQMVALNWQTYDIHMQMNQAMFAAGSDRTGYVLKPSYLRDPTRFDGLTEMKAKLPHYKINFKIKVISAQQLPLLSTMAKGQLISPFVQVQMFSAEDVARSIAYGQGGESVSRPDGLYGIGRPFIRQTKTVPDNGFNPQFNDVLELSIETKYPELVFVRFVVYQSGKTSKELAVFTSKLDSLQRGYRHLPLYNNHGEELIFSSLYCHIAKEKPKPISHESKPVRQGSLRKLISRSNTSERGRNRGETVADNERLAVQRRLNQEIESKRR